MRIPNFIAISFIALAILMLHGCGRKGALFMQPPAPAPAAQPQTQAAQPMAIPAQSQPAPTSILQTQSEPTK